MLVVAVAVARLFVNAVLVVCARSLDSAEFPPPLTFLELRT